MEPLAVQETHQSHSRRRRRGSEVLYPAWLALPVGGTPWRPIVCHWRRITLSNRSLSLKGGLAAQHTRISFEVRVAGRCGRYRHTIAIAYFLRIARFNAANRHVVAVRFLTIDGDIADFAAVGLDELSLETNVPDHSMGRRRDPYIGA